MAITDALGGLDALEQPQAATANGASTLADRAWRAAWPKLAAIAVVLLIWELIAASGWKKRIFPAPGRTLANLWDQLGTGLLWHAIGTTLYRALIGFALALVIGAVIGAVVSRVRPLRAAVGSLLTGLQTMPSIAWFPFAIILFGLTTQAIMFVI